MAEPGRTPTPAQRADERVQQVLRAAESWSRDVPRALAPAIRAVCVRLTEMVADQRHYLAPLPEPQETERRQVLQLIAERLRSKAVTNGIEHHLKGLAELELRATASWAINAAAQQEWITVAVQYLEERGRELPVAEQPDDFWADDVVAGIIASARALIGVDELHARTEARYASGGRRETRADQE